MNTVASLPAKLKPLADEITAMATKKDPQVRLDRVAGIMGRITALLSEHGEVTVTTDESGRCVAVTRQDSEGRILSVIWEASEHGGGGEARPRCGDERYELDAYIWKRESTQEWVLELSGTIGDAHFISRHCEPLTTPPEDVAGLPSMYAAIQGESHD